jgi:hypothetical protein
MTELFVTGMARITMPYTVDGFNHKCRLYGRNVQPVSGSFNINSRATDANDQVWTDAAAGMEYAVSALLPSAATYSPFLLEKWDGSVWEPLANTTIAPTNVTGSYVKASQITLTFKDTALEKLKLVVVEGTEALAQKFRSPTGGDSAMDICIAEFLSTHVGTHAPYVWAVSHRDLYLSSSPFVSASVWPNRKIARRRGV